MKFDVAVIGGGPAGMSACVFTTRAGLSTICFEKLAIGGQAALSYDIVNYPGFKSVSGIELTQHMYEQAKGAGANFVFGDVLKVKQLKNGFSIKTRRETYHANKIIIASGSISKKLGLGEDRYIGKGISYCASCDGNFFKGQPVAIVGGGDSAFVYAEYLSHLASKVYILNRSDKLKANAYRIEAVKKLKNVKILMKTQIESLVGENKLTGLILNNGKTLNVEALFVAIGHVPNLDYLDFNVDVDKNGYILVDDHMRTNIKNVYACGDIVSKHFRQIVTACADGAVAGNSCIGE